MLKFTDANQFFNNCKYIYPVLSRRAQGISLGINLNPNNACNWKCIYCQVEGLIRGNPPPIDITVLDKELHDMLEWIIHGDFLANFAPKELRRLNDICIAGNGEPTLSPNFLEACNSIAHIRQQYQLTNQVKTILITNGSQMHKPTIQQGLNIIAKNNGEVWFKIDRINSTSINEINQVNLSTNLISKNLITSSQHCTTFIQSCWFKNNNQSPSTQEITEFVSFLKLHQEYFKQVLLYSVARNSAQPEGKNLVQFSLEDFTPITDLLKQHKIEFKVYP